MHNDPNVGGTLVGRGGLATTPLNVSFTKGYFGGGVKMVSELLVNLPKGAPKGAGKGLGGRKRTHRNPA